MSLSLKPVLLYDGECSFCCIWIERWKRRTGDRVEYREAGGGRDFAGIPKSDLSESVQLIETDGTRFQGAEAVIRLLATESCGARAWLWAYRSAPLIARVSEFGYRFVARNRRVISLVTRLSRESASPGKTYSVSTLIYLRLLGLTYFIAFVSYGVQAPGLIGGQGIMPIRGVLPRAWEALGADACWRVPTLCWLDSSDGMITGMAWAGSVLSLAAIAGMMLPAVLFLLWALYLSLVVAGQVFYSFQWDALLLEAGFLSIFIASFSTRPGFEAVSPPRLSRWLLLWLLFRLMFASGVVKLSSHDPAWAHLTALEYHYFTQPIPTPAAWYAQQMPAWFQKVSAGFMFFVELVLPFFIFGGRRPRLIAFAGFVMLQAGIAVTGNYGFFNLLAVALSFCLVDDAAWASFLRLFGWKLRDSTGRGALKPRFLPGWIRVPAGAALATLSLIPFLSSSRQEIPWPAPLLKAYEAVAPFQSINGYGLFAIMTTKRQEILIQGSMDGIEWRTYAFKYKPGALNRPPPFVAPHMPRLDWQMWFAALGSAPENPWLFGLMARLLEAEPNVLKLLADDPFDGSKPRFVRAMLDDYRFTDFEERKRTGNWWKGEPAAIYCREISTGEIR